MVIQELDTVSDEDSTVVNPSSPSAGPPPQQPPHSSLHASQQSQPVVPPSGVQQIQTLATQGADEDSATVDPQRGHHKDKHNKSMDSDEDDEESQDESGTFSNSQPTVPVLSLHLGPAASSQ